MKKILLLLALPLTSFAQYTKISITPVTIPKKASNVLFAYKDLRANGDSVLIHWIKTDSVNERISDGYNLISKPDYLELLLDYTNEKFNSVFYFLEINAIKKD